MENIKRLQYNIKAIEMYQEELKKAIEKEDDFRIYLNIGNLLHWIIMTEEWHKEHTNIDDKYEENNKKKSMEELMRAVRFANNSMKHNMIFHRLHLLPTAVSCGSDETVCGTFYCGTDEVLWNDVKSPKIKHKNRHQFKGKGQYRCYDEYLKLNNVVETLNPVVEFLIKETEDYLSKKHNI